MCHKTRVPLAPSFISCLVNVCVYIYMYIRTAHKAARAGLDIAGYVLAGLALCVLYPCLQALRVPRLQSEPLVVTAAGLVLLALHTGLVQHEPALAAWGESLGYVACFFVVDSAQAREQ